MHLKSLEISGFKSFAKKDELSFSTPITAIVGPNGSGKSNVAEAFRFVLGEQSIKSMRGKKGEDLIFNGSPSASRSNRAMVRIVLDNSKKTFPVDFDEVSVERTVHRDGTNDYSINGSRSRLKDVIELLSAANIGQTGHHIISQGEADRILSSNAKERREMIEDALGLKVYQYKKAESEKKLERTLENIEQVNSLRREVQPHLKFLERQVKKIEKSLELREKLSVFYKEYLKREDEYIAHHHDRLTKAKAGPVEKLETLRKELEKAKAVLQSEKKDEKRDALVALEEKLHVLRDARQSSLREEGKLDGQITYLERTLTDREQEREKAEAAPVPFERVKEVVDQIEKQSGVPGKDADVHTLRSALDGVLKTLRSFLNDVSRSGNSEEDAALRDELITLKKEVDVHREKLNALESEEKQLNTDYEALKRSIEAELSESREAEREVFRIMGSERDLQQELNDIEREIKDLERDRFEFKRELEEAVALMGPEMSQYFSFDVKDKGGESIARDAIIHEDRETQLERRRELEKMKIRLEEIGGGSAREVMKEYEEVKGRDEFLEREIEDLNKSVASLEELIKDLTQKLNEQFLMGIEKIDVEFSRLFALMFGGGTAALKLVKPKVKKKKSEEELLLEEISKTEEDDDEDEVVEEGVEIDVTLPHKRIKGLEMLSGGERALTSIALIFAMSQVNPPLFLILDETDAALDEANSRRYGDMIAALAEKSQLILITHNRETMSRAGVLYGITMGADGISKLLSVKFEEAVAVSK